MEAIQIEILNPKALQFIKGMQDLDLIKVKEEPATALKAYLNKMREQSAKVPDLDEISTMVEEVRTNRYARK